VNVYARTADAYLTQRILGATPEQQAALIMEAGQLHLGRAIQALKQNNLPSATGSFIRVAEVIMEATTRLDLDEGGEVSLNLKRLYDWWTREILVSSKARDTTRLEAVMQGMGEIRQAWERLHEKNTANDRAIPASPGDRVI
jgi:flagellar protein FliS